MQAISERREALRLVEDARVESTGAQGGADRWLVTVKVVVGRRHEGARGRDATAEYVWQIDLVVDKHRTSERPFDAWISTHGGPPGAVSDMDDFEALLTEKPSDLGVDSSGMDVAERFMAWFVEHLV